MARERTFLMVKPDGVQRHLVGDIVKRFETKGFQLVAMKFMQASEHLLEQHYAEHVGKPFFNGLVNYIKSGPVVAMVWEGQDVVAMARTMMGATKPSAAAPGTIRGDYCVVMSRNVIHGSDSVESAQREIGLWFPEGVVEWGMADDDWLNMPN